MEPAGDDLTRPGATAPVAPSSLPLQVRVERSRAGRALISVAVLALLVSVVVWNLPSSGLKAALQPVVRPGVEAFGLDQNWAVFAPNPRRLTLDLSAVIEFADGTSSTWMVPLHGEPFLTPYRSYRWQKWMEHARADGNERLWAAAARWLAHEFSSQGEVVRVRLIRHWYDTAPPGWASPDVEWNTFEYHVYDVAAATP